MNFNCYAVEINRKINSNVKQHVRNLRVRSDCAVRTFQGVSLYWSKNSSNCPRDISKSEISEQQHILRLLVIYLVKFTEII